MCNPSQNLRSTHYKTTIEGLSRTFNKEYWNYAKLISGVLRHGMPLSFVVDMVSNLHLNDDPNLLPVIIDQLDKKQLRILTEKFRQL